MKQLFKFCLLAFGLVSGWAVQAQGSAVSSQLLAERVVTVDGKTVLQPAGQGKSGDVIQYSATYRNGGAASADKLLATVPVPTGTTLVAGSVQPAQAQASTDGAVFAPMPLLRQVKQADGSMRQEAVPLAEYRALRWEIGSLPAGRTTVVSLRTRIDSPPVAAAAARP
jgi:uncharacterized repeat protein (TIGR01451 family)